MQIPLEITFRGMPPSASVEAAIARAIDRVERVHDRIQSCHVWIDVPHRHRRRGASFQVKLALAIPGGKRLNAHAEDEDVYLAVTDIFDAARRQLLDHLRSRRGAVERHAA
jgi:ribosomal subunit interface protein